MLLAKIVCKEAEAARNHRGIGAIGLHGLNQGAPASGEGDALAADFFDDGTLEAFDQRNAGVITVPDTTRRYRVVSRQSLDDAQVADRDQNAFKGNLRIASASKFWAPSRYLVLLEE